MVRSNRLGVGHSQRAMVSDGSRRCMRPRPGRRDVASPLRPSASGRRPPDYVSHGKDAFKHLASRRTSKVIVATAHGIRGTASSRSAPKAQVSPPRIIDRASITVDVQSAGFVSLPSIVPGLRIALTRS